MSGDIVLLNEAGLFAQWACVVCGALHPVDHEGIFCGRCKRMACCSCEREMPKHECEFVAWYGEGEGEEVDDGEEAASDHEAR